MKKLFPILCTMLLSLFTSVQAEAALYDRGGGLIYDSDLNITWLQDANYAKTSGYDSDGRMLWDDEVAWADGLSYYDSVRGVTWTDWRLPTTVDGTHVFGTDGTTTAGYNITSSEMGYMYYVNLGNLGYYSTDGTFQPEFGLANAGPFNNIQTDRAYWSGTEYSANPVYAWVFKFFWGYQGAIDSDGEYKAHDRYYAWAVRPGDVPIPCSVWLLGSGLIGIVGIRRKFKS